MPENEQLRDEYTQLLIDIQNRTEAAMVIRNQIEIVAILLCLVERGGIDMKDFLKTSIELAKKKLEEM